MPVFFCLFFVSKINTAVILYDGTMKEPKSCMEDLLNEIYKKRNKYHQ